MAKHEISGSVALIERLRRLRCIIIEIRMTTLCVGVEARLSLNENEDAEIRATWTSLSSELSDFAATVGTALDEPIAAKIVEPL